MKLPCRAIRLGGIATALVALSACAIPPEGTSEQDRANFNTALASIGCDLVDTGDYQAMEIQTGMSRATLSEMVSYKLQTEEIVRLSNGGVRLVTGNCAPAPEAAAPAA